MITNKEINEVNVSATKKDYYQIWNELIELADKISERWSPVSTNESDPGVVLLKVLTAVADKLNYNIDKNTLEAFMPSATQEESMRKLTEMMGYNMKYYQSATCKVSIAMKEGINPGVVYFPKFVNLKNEDESINYVTLEEFTLQAAAKSREVTAIEGELIECEADNDNIISMIQLDDLNRYLLPEATIAENGIFITNIENTLESQEWKQVDNLNTQLPGSRVYKVGFNSERRLLYIQFPDDISNIIKDGLRIKYIRTNGLNGNITTNFLNKLEKPAIWSTSEDPNITNLAATDFEVSNITAATNGADPESLNAAYNNFKKTIGTFDTLVTCRDYMNKIYQMTESTTDTTPLVSNIIVSDIRDDINRSTPLCSFNEYGICYKDVSLKNTDSTDQIEHFDLLLYPFRTVYGLNTKSEYEKSFKYDASNMFKIKNKLQDSKTVAHEIISPNSDEIACIKNYLKIKARISTIKKVTYLENQEILNNVYKAIYKNFNARQLDFGEEIPYESIVEVLKNADYRIKDIIVDDPALYTKFCLVDGTELDLVSQEESPTNEKRINTLYNKLALRNILAGKIAAFSYDESFNTNYTQVKPTNFEPIYPVGENKIVKVVSRFELPDNIDPDGYTLTENQVVQFKCPNFKTIITYPAYVNYFFKKVGTSGENNLNKIAIPATFESLYSFMAVLDDANVSRWETFINDSDSAKNNLEELTDLTETNFSTELKDRITICYKNDDSYKIATNFSADTTYYYLQVDEYIFASLQRWIKDHPLNGVTLRGIYKSVGIQENGVIGQLVDTDCIKYLPTTTINRDSSNFKTLKKYFVQQTHTEKTEDHTIDGLGQNADLAGVSIGSEYQLNAGEYLLINYTETEKTESGEEVKHVVNKQYTEGTIIKPNFALVDSLLYHSTHSYSKRDGFNFEVNPEGMFTLGTNEQIEIRDFVRVELDEADSYIYWVLNSDDLEAAYNEFIFNEDYGLDEDRKDSNGNEWIKDGKPIHNAYTLKDGENFFYTTSRKQNLVYYGTGTTIVKSSTTPTLRKSNLNGIVSAENIMSNGLTESIPWVKQDLRGTRKLTIFENQFTSLTEGDTLYMVKTTSDVSGSLNNQWIEGIKEAEFKFAENDFNSNLPSINVAGINWAARTRLDFNMSKDTAQKLAAGRDFLDVYYSETQETPDLVLKVEEVESGSTTEAETIEVNSNYTCQAAMDTFITKNWPDFKLKISKSQPINALPESESGETLALNNYINGDTFYTKIDFAEETFKDLTPEDNIAFELNISIPTATVSGNSPFGLIMFYYNQQTEGTTLTLSVNDGTISKFNTSETPEDSIDLTETGLYIIKISNEVSKVSVKVNFEEFPDGALIFSNLRIVNGINPKLDYRLIDTNTTLDQLLKDIQDLGEEISGSFYYSIPVQASSDIEINELVEDEKLSSPYIWYDPNNINNKFVISEIDSDYLSTGITINKSSRI